MLLGQGLAGFGSPVAECCSSTLRYRERVWLTHFTAVLTVTWKKHAYTHAEGKNIDGLACPHCQHTGAFTVNGADVWDWLTDITVPPAEAPLQYFSVEVRACPGRAPFYNLLSLSLCLLSPFPPISLFLFWSSLVLSLSHADSHNIQGGQSGPLTLTGVRKSKQTWLSWSNEDSKRAVGEELGTGSNCWEAIKKFIRCNSDTAFTPELLSLHGTQAWERCTHVAYPLSLSLSPSVCVTSGPLLVSVAEGVRNVLTLFEHLNAWTELSSESVIQRHIFRILIHMCQLC